ncbi:MAG: sulfurtransferase TusA family protein, partial [Candidatus Thorarchaeota archaeon]
DVGAKKDIPAMLNKTGNELVELREDNGHLVFVIKKT